MREAPRNPVSKRRVSRIVPFVLALSAGFVLGTSASSGDPVVPCADPRGCPDLIVDAHKLNQWHVDQQTFADTDCAVIEGEVTKQPGPHLLLRFTSNTPNYGQGDLIIGDPAAHPDWFMFQNCHGHPHFKDYGDYRLWTQKDYSTWTTLRAAHPDMSSRDLLAHFPDVASKMVAGHKQGFCVIDVIPAAIPGTLPPRPPQYFSCTTNQGISVGWADEYQFLLDGQWIDITDVPPGPYVLEVEVNAGHFFQESDYSNNAAAVNIIVPDHPGRGPRH